MSSASAVDNNTNSNNNRKKKNPWPPDSEKADQDMSLWGILVFGFIGATATTLAAFHLRRTIDFFVFQFSRAQSSNKGSYSSGGSFRSSFQEEARRRYQKRMQEEYEEEMERVERIRRMQSVFNREKKKHQRNYESWRENDRGTYTQNFQREDWYWSTNKSYKDYSRTHFNENSRANPTYLLSHHYAILGLDRARTEPYTESEIKTAFRKKAMQFHPDQNQGNKEVAEAKFKEVMISYEAIRAERQQTKQ